MHKPAPAALFVLLGVAAMVPWYALITEVQFFRSVFCGSEYERVFLNAYTFSYLVCDVFAAFLLLFGHKFFSKTTLVTGPLWKTIVGFSVLSFLSLVPVGPSAFFAITLWIVVVSGLVKSLFLAGCSGIAAEHPNRHYVPSLLCGMAVAGVLVSLTSLIWTAVAGEGPAVSEHEQDLALEDQNKFCEWPTDMNSTQYESFQCPEPSASWPAFAYFISSVLFAAAALVAFKVFDKSAAVPRITSSPRSPQNIKQVELEERGRQSRSSSASDLASDPYYNNDDGGRGRSTANLRGALWEIARQSRLYLVVVAFSQIVTLMLFPTVVAETTSEKRCAPGSAAFHNELFTPTLFFIFNIFDLLGRSTVFKCKPPSDATLLVTSIGRAVLIPIMWLSNLRFSKHAAIFQQDFWPILCVSLLGFTNGFIISSSFEKSLALGNSEDRRHLALVILIFGLNVGLLLGSVFSYVSLAAIHQW